MIDVPAATIVLGVIFLGIKAVEYHENYDEHLVPGLRFRTTTAPDCAHTRRLFFSSTSS